MKHTVKELINMKGRNFYSFTTACLSLVDESNRLNRILRENNKQVENLSKADFIVVTTCAVSKDSAQNSVSNILRLSKASGNKQIYVGGCLANANEREALTRLKNVKFFTADEIFKAIDKIDVICEKTTTRCAPFWLKDMAGKRKHLEILQAKDKRLAELYAFTTDGIVFQNMPFKFDTIRISKGCNKKCSYCAIPNNRGRYLEHDFSYVSAQIKDSKNKHILLIGENIGTHKEFDKIMKYAISCRKILMLRYLEPEYINKIKREYLKHIIYIGVPVQSGSSKVLKSMRRPQNLAAVKEKFKEWHKHDIFLGTSIILSYPTETIIDFLKTLWFIASAPISYASFQNFSPRENSPVFDRYKEYNNNNIRADIKYRIFDWFVKLKAKSRYI